MLIMKQLYRVIHFSSFRFRLIVLLISLWSCNALLFANFIPDRQIKSDTSNANKLAMPLCFVKNEGQYSSEFKYKLHTAGLNLFFSDSNVTYQFYIQQKSVDSIGLSDKKINAKVNNIAVSFLHTSKDVALLGEEKLETKNNFFIGNNPANWQLDVPLFKNLMYNNIYKNVDIKYYSLKGKIK